MPTKPVDRTKEWRASDNPAFKPILSWKIEQRDPDQNGKEPLTRQYQHNSTGDDQNKSETIFEYEQQQPYDRVVVRPGRSMTSTMSEIVRGDADDQYRHNYQA